MRMDAVMVPVMVKGTHKSRGNKGIRRPLLAFEFSLTFGFSGCQARDRLERLSRT